MALMISISSYISSGYTNPVIWRLYEAGSLVFVDDHQELPPHGQVYNFSFVNNIRDIVYRIDLYDQPGGVGVGNLIKSHNVTVSTSTLIVDADIETIVDGGQPEDPTGGASTSPIIPALVGKDFYVVQRGIGQLREVRDVETIDNLDGSYSLTGGNTFNTQDTYVIKIRAQYVVNPPGSQSISIYKDILLITTDTDLTSADFGKLLIVDGSTPVVTLQLPALATIIEKVSLFIESVGTSHINVVLKAAIGETITATGTTSNTFILSRGTKAELMKLGTTLYGFTDDNDIKCRGQIEWGYSVGLNRLWADGTEYLTANYPGLKKAMDNMQTGTVVTYTQWATNSYKGFFALSDDNTHFKVPDLRNKFIRALNGTGTDAQRLTQGPGGAQAEMIGPHYHLTGTETDTVDGSQYRQGAVHHIRGWNGGVLTTNFPASTASNDGTENRPANIGLIPLIII